MALGRRGKRVNINKVKMIGKVQIGDGRMDGSPDHPHSAVVGHQETDIRLKDSQFLLHPSPFHLDLRWGVGMLQEEVMKEKEKIKRTNTTYDRNKIAFHLCRRPAPFLFLSLPRFCRSHLSLHYLHHQKLINMIMRKETMQTINEKVNKKAINCQRSNPKMKESW